MIHVSPGVETTIHDEVLIGHLAHLEGCIVHDGAFIGTASLVLPRGSLWVPGRWLPATWWCSTVPTCRPEPWHSGPGHDPARCRTAGNGGSRSSLVRGRGPSLPSGAPTDSLDVVSNLNALKDTGMPRRTLECPEGHRAGPDGGNGSPRVRPRRYALGCRRAGLVEQGVVSRALVLSGGGLGRAAQRGRRVWRPGAPIGGP